MELFAWRQFSNRRQVGAVTGLVPTPYKSGRSRASKASAKPATGTCGRLPCDRLDLGALSAGQRTHAVVRDPLRAWRAACPESRDCRSRASTDGRSLALSGRRRHPRRCAAAAVEIDTRRRNPRRVAAALGPMLHVSWGERPGGRSLVLIREPPSRWGRFTTECPGATHLCFCAQPNSADTDRRRVTARGRASLMGPSSPRRRIARLAPRQEDTGVLTVVKTPRAALAAGAVLTTVPRARRWALVGASRKRVPERCASSGA